MTIPGYLSHHELPHHAIRVADSNSTRDIRADLLDDPDADLIFLFESSPSGVMQRFSDVGYITGSSDTPADTPYPPGSDGIAG